MKPPSTARTAGRSDWAERRFRRQPFILLSFSSSKKLRKAQETQLYQRFQHIVHTVFNTSGTNGPHSLLQMKVGTHSPLPTGSHTRAHTPKQGHFGWGGIAALGAFRTFTNIPGPGIRTAYFAAFGSWSGMLPKNAESLRNSDALMRVAVPRRRGPAGPRCSVCNLVMLLFFHSARRAFRTCERGGGITTLGALCVFSKRWTAGCQKGKLCRFCALAGGALEERREPAGQRCAHARRCPEASRPRWAA